MERQNFSGPPSKKLELVMNASATTNSRPASSNKVQPPRKAYEGSLLRLFKSELFTIHMIVEYLYRRREQGIQDFLISSKLYNESITGVDFYMPQLWLGLGFT